MQLHEGRRQHIGLTRHPLEGPPQVDPTAWRRGETARDHGTDRQRHALGKRFSQGEFGCSHRLKICPLQALALGKAERRFELDFVLTALIDWIWRLGCLRCREGFGQPIRPLALDLITPTTDLGQHQVHQAFEQLRIAPKRIENLIENHLLLAAVQHHRRQGGPNILAPIKPDCFNRCNRGKHAVGANLHPGVAQHPREMNHVFREHDR